MPRITIYAADIREEDLLQIAERVADRFEYDIEDTEDGLRVRKGSLFVSILVGAFMLYVDFRVMPARGRRDELALDIEWEIPWWTGFIGVGRSKKEAIRYADAIEDRIERAGGEVLERETR